MKKIVISIFIICMIGLCMLTVGGSQITLTEIGELHTGSRTVGVYVKETILYALDLELGLKIYNISDPTSPKEIGSFQDAYTFSHAFCYTDDLILIADYEDKLEIVNVSDTSNPVLIGKYQEADENIEHIGSTNLHFMENHIFLASQYEGVEVINIEDPLNPVEIGTYYFGKSINVVYAKDNLAFIREMGGDFKILDITNLTNPLEIYHCKDVNTGQNFFVMNNLLYVPDIDFGLRIWNITNPENSFKVGEKEIDGRCMKCVVEKRGTDILAYLSVEEAGLTILDVTDPENIEEIVQYNDGGKSFSIFIQNNMIFIAEFSAGLEILQIEGFYSSTTSLSSTTSTSSRSTSNFDIIIVFIGMVLVCLILRINNSKRFQS